MLAIRSRYSVAEKWCEDHTKHAWEQGTPDKDKREGKDTSRLSEALQRIHCLNHQSDLALGLNTNSHEQTASVVHESEKKRSTEAGVSWLYPCNDKQRPQDVARKGRSTHCTKAAVASPGMGALHFLDIVFLILSRSGWLVITSGQP
jgi:hypothetical protein